MPLKAIEKLVKFMKLNCVAAQNRPDRRAGKSNELQKTPAHIIN